MKKKVQSTEKSQKFKAKSPNLGIKNYYSKEKKKTNFEFEVKIISSKFWKNSPKFVVKKS